MHLASKYSHRINILDLTFSLVITVITLFEVVSKVTMDEKLYSLFLNELCSIK